MKSLLLFVFGFLLLTTSVHSQQQYTVDGNTYTLKTEVEGSLTLLWNTIDGEYRYFSKKENEILELKNTKQEGRYQEEFKQVLQKQTADVNISTEKVNLTLPSLHTFFAEYNTLRNPSYTETKKNIDLQFRLGAYVGVTNSVYTENINNTLQGVGGLELEMIDAVKLRRHAMVLGFRHTFESSDHKYSASQFSLNYRFKFIKTPKLDVFLNAKFATFTFFKKEITYIKNEITVTENESGSDFNAPLTFGIGADYKVGNGYITFNYHDIVGLNVDSNKEFPIDFSLGYKFNL
ncbi:MAG TPA: hypothetical protein VKX40_15560 [Aequorivita sp.]|nr:hypothetical protein [Aequorivita sp.]